MDLLSTLIHEIGHALGDEHSESGTMDSTLAAGEIRQPIDWNRSSADLWAALGWNNSSDKQKPAFPEFFIGNSRKNPKKRLYDEIGGETEAEPMLRSTGTLKFSHRPQL